VNDGKYLRKYGKTGLDCSSFAAEYNLDGATLAGGSLRTV
jgi:hypothetical protein